ncbi:MAG: hypothetical protein HQK97_11220 [Nitrospirae bacterium]|nr:hypothetical protein [Nitrospirota bacterium]
MYHKSNNLPANKNHPELVEGFPLGVDARKKGAFFDKLRMIRIFLLL